MAVDLNSSGVFEPNSSLDQRLAGLVSRLSEAQRRVTRGAALHGLVTSAVIALGVFVVLQLLASLFGTNWPFAFELGLPDTVHAATGQHLVIAAVIGVVALIVSIVSAVMGRPWLNSMARAADERFKLDECMSTALEVAAERKTGVISEALIESARARTGVVNATSLVPIRPPRIAWAIPVLAAVAVLISLYQPPAIFDGAANSPGGNGGGTTTVALETRQATAADLHAIAAILRRDGEERADPTIQAIARQIEDLAVQLDTNANIDGEATAAALERLNDLARVAYERAGETAGGARDQSRLTQAAFEQFAPERAAAAAARQAAGQRPEQANPEAGDVDVPFEAAVLHGGETAGEAMAPAPGMAVNADDITRTDAPGNRAELTGGMVNDADDVYGPDGPDGPGGPIPDAGAGAGEYVGPAGGAEAGDFAGRGEADLFGETAGILTPAELAAEMMLTDRNPGDGRRIIVDLPPLTQLMGVTTDGMPAPGGWEAFAEGQVTRTPVPAADRDVVQRYFDAMKAERTE